MRNNSIERNTVMDSIKTAYTEFIDSLVAEDKEKEAYDFIESVTGTQPTRKRPRVKKPIKRQLHNNNSPNVPIQPQVQPPQQAPQNEEEPAVFEKSPNTIGPGSVAPILELGKIIDKIKLDSSYSGLPNDVKSGIAKIEKMTENAFKFASEIKVAKTTLQKLKKNLDLFGRAHADLSPRIVSKLTALQKLVDSEISGGQPVKKNKVQPSPEKGFKAPKGIRQKSRAQKEDVTNMRDRAQKGLEDLDAPEESTPPKTAPVQNPVPQTSQVPESENPKPTTVSEPELTPQAPNNSKGVLKSKLLKHPTYSQIFYRLPPPIIKELNRIGLGLDDLKEKAPVKVASHVNRVLSMYLKNRKASSELDMGIEEETKEHSDIYKKLEEDLDKKDVDVPISLNDFAIQIAKAHLKEDPKYYTKLRETFKESMDFTGIGNIITPKNKLSDREIARTLRLAIAAELDAVHLYELIVDATKDKSVKKVLQDIANEEKVHVGELQELLKKFDDTDEGFLEEGKNEVEDLN